MNQSFAQKSAFEAALIRKGVPYFTTSLGIHMARDRMDIEEYGDLIRGYDHCCGNTIVIPHSEIV